MTVDSVNEYLPVPRLKDALAEVIEPVSKLDLLTLSTVMVQSGLFPDLKSMSQGVVKILAGRELGFPPIASLRHIYVHRGHIGLMATLIATKIRESDRYDYRVVKSTDTECDIEFTRLGKDGKWRIEGVSSFSIDEAKRAGLVKSDSAWIGYPSDVLFARAMTRGQRRFCPDVFGQTVYAPEEITSLPSDVPDEDEADKKYEHLMPKERLGASPGPAEVAEASPGMESQPPVEPVEPPGVAEPEPATPPVEPAAPVADPSAAPAAPASAAVFELNGHEYRTAGITKDQMVETFKLAPRVDKERGKGTAKNILLNEFKVQTRVDLSSELAERYLIRLRECVGDA